MTNQVETKQVTWEDMEVAQELQMLDPYQPPHVEPEKPVTEWEEGNEPLPVEYEPLPRGVIILLGIDEETWNEGAEKFVRENPVKATFYTAGDIYRIPTSVRVNANISLDDMAELQERMGNKIQRLQMMYDSTFGAPLCIASRNYMTAHLEAPVIE